jgi:uroporphyrinogen decarboxylase
MDMVRLKQLFGKKIVFHGGIENQQVLPRGTVQDVIDETRNCLASLGGDGEGYICCSCHNAQAGTPVENILAMIDTVKTFKRKSQL